MTHTQLMNLIAQYFDCEVGASRAYVQESNAAHFYRVIDLRLPVSAMNGPERLRETLWDLLRQLHGDKRPKLYWRYDYRLSEEQEGAYRHLYTRIAIPGANWLEFEREVPYQSVGQR